MGLYSYLRNKVGVLALETGLKRANNCITRHMKYFSAPRSLLAAAGGGYFRAFVTASEVPLSVMQSDTKVADVAKASWCFFCAKEPAPVPEALIKAVAVPSIGQVIALICAAASISQVDSIFRTIAEEKIPEPQGETTWQALKGWYNRKKEKITKNKKSPVADASTRLAKTLLRQSTAKIIQLKNDLKIVCANELRRASREAIRTIPTTCWSVACAASCGFAMWEGVAFYALYRALTKLEEMRNSQAASSPKTSPETSPKRPPQPESPAADPAEKSKQSWFKFGKTDPKNDEKDGEPAASAEKPKTKKRFKFFSRDKANSQQTAPADKAPQTDRQPLSAMSEHSSESDEGDTEETES